MWCVMCDVVNVNARTGTRASRASGTRVSLVFVVCDVVWECVMWNVDDVWV